MERVDSGGVQVCASTYNISRQDQDEYAIESYARANKAHAAGEGLIGWVDEWLAGWLNELLSG